MNLATIWWSGRIAYRILIGFPATFAVRSVIYPFSLPTETLDSGPANNAT